MSLMASSGSGCVEPVSGFMRPASIFAGTVFYLRDLGRLKEPLQNTSRQTITTGKETKMKNFYLRRLLTPGILLGGIAILGACSSSPAPNTGHTATSSPATVSTASPAISPEVANPAEASLQKLVGRWDGPEGTYLIVTDKLGADGKQQLPRKFTVEIKDLDKAEKFEGTAKDGIIQFERKGKTETVKAATGVETGMKGFEKEANCVVVTKGSEGFCKPAAAAQSSPSASPGASPDKAAPKK